jgi:hypothetical protein
MKHFLTFIMNKYKFHSHFHPSCFLLNMTLNLPSSSFFFLSLLACVCVSWGKINHYFYFTPKKSLSTLLCHISIILELSKKNQFSPCLTTPTRLLLEYISLFRRLKIYIFSLFSFLTYKKQFLNNSSLPSSIRSRVHSLSICRQMMTLEPWLGGMYNFFLYFQISSISLYKKN